MMKHFPINKEKMKKSLVDPMQEKDRLMKMEHLLSNNYVIAGMLIVIDLLLFFALNYVSHLLVSLPGYLLKRITTTELFSLSVSVSGGCFDQWVSGVFVRGDGRGCDPGGTDQDCLGRRTFQCGAERETAVYDSGRDQRTVSGDRSVGNQIPGGTRNPDCTDRRPVLYRHQCGQ